MYKSLVGKIEQQLVGAILLSIVLLFTGMVIFQAPSSWEINSFSSSFPLLARYGDEKLPRSLSKHRHSARHFFGSYIYWPRGLFHHYTKNKVTLLSERILLVLKLKSCIKIATSSLRFYTLSLSLGGFSISK